MGNRALKTMRGITPWPASKVNPFRESDKMKSEYDATIIIGNSSASCASYSRDAWKAKLPIPTTAMPYECIRDYINLSVHDTDLNKTNQESDRITSGKLLL